MRIADHAVALQSSQALQQPAVNVHQQQVAGPKVAIDAAAVEAQQKASQVNQQSKTEGLTVKNEAGGKSKNPPRRRRAKGSLNETQTVSSEDPVGGPDAEGHLDIVV